MKYGVIKIVLLVVVVLAVGAAAGFGGSYWFSGRQARKQEIQKAEQAREEANKIPVEVITKKPTSTSTSTPPKPGVDTKTPTSTPEQSARTGAFNLSVQFVPQAPKKIWDHDHEEYCEEASLLAVHGYNAGKKFSIDQMEAELAKLRDWQKEKFGYFESTTVEETATIAREYFGYTRVRIIENPTLEQIRAEVAAGNPVLVPADGKALKNPYFKNGGPVYHMFVVRGFTANGDIITNDPGTQYGENYVYKTEVFMNALHDWDHGQDFSKPASGARRVLVIQ